MQNYIILRSLPFPFVSRNGPFVTRRGWFVKKWVFDARHPKFFL